MIGYSGLSDLVLAKSIWHATLIPFDLDVDFAKLLEYTCGLELKLIIG